MTEPSSLGTGVPNAGSNPELNAGLTGAPSLNWTPEEFVFGLQYAGRSAGTTRWLSGPDRNHWLIRVETNFSGILGAVRRVQVSKLELATGLPVSYIESDGGNGRSFETTFDRKAGLVTVHQHRDVASVALTQDYLDPVSVLQMLRTLPEETSCLRIPMVGGTVLIARLPDETVQAPWGDVNAKVYYLRPGIGLVYIESEAPHRILKLGQTVGKFMLEGWLMRAGVPQVLPTQVERGRESVQQPRAQTAQGHRGQGPRARQQEGRRNRSDRNDGSRSSAPDRAQAGNESQPGQGRSGQVRTDQLRSDQLRSDQLRSDQSQAEPHKTDPARGEGSKRGNRRRRRNENREANRDANREAGSDVRLETTTPGATPSQQNPGTLNPTGGQAGTGQASTGQAAGGPNETPRKRRRRRSRRGNARGPEGGGES
jgi:Protein of unknown function (DUF3108)